MAAQRVIFHCDCNSFYASVELLTRPELKNVPVAVCGNPQHRHGIILAKNEAAKKYGIQTAETVASARRKCPQLALLPPHHELYRAYSKQVNAIYARYTEFVEPFGIDESWLDMTASWHLFGPSPVAVAHRIRREVKAQTGLTISVGVSFTKAFAKLGSDYKKPDAVTEFSPENYRQLAAARGRAAVCGPLCPPDTRQTGHYHHRPACRCFSPGAGGSAGQTGHGTLGLCARRRGLARAQHV
jgi:DNA polymerase-4